MLIGICAVHTFILIVGMASSITCNINVSESRTKKNSVQLSTFLNWNVGHIISHEVKNDSLGRATVTKIWCKLCARHSDKIHSEVKGRSREEIDSYIVGTQFITKHTVLRHLGSRTHSSAVGKYYERFIIHL